MIKSLLTFTQVEADRTRKMDIVAEGIPLHEEYSPDGVRITLMREPGVTMDTLESAAKWCYGQRDVVGRIEWAEVKPEHYDQ